VGGSEWQWVAVSGNGSEWQLRVAVDGSRQCGSGSGSRSQCGS
jgi:hypothetical protein